MNSPGTGPQERPFIPENAADGVEIAIEEGSKEGSDYVITMREAGNLDSPTLRFTPAEWDAFVAGVRDGEFDLDEDGQLVELPERDEPPAGQPG